MSSYAGIAPYYDRIFPYDEVQIGFIQSLLGSTQKHRYLDIGCATGTLLAEFSSRFDSVVGLDLDAELLEIAEEKLNAEAFDNVELYESDMRELSKLFSGSRFSFISCLGNTLPHLTDAAEIARVFEAVHALLEPEGQFVFQIVNYDRILDNNIRRLPTIETGDLTFDRYYSGPKADGCVDFDIILKDSDVVTEIKEHISLLPVRKEQLEKYIKAAGFSRFEFFGDYAGAAYSPDSFLLIGVCGL